MFPEFTVTMKRAVGLFLGKGQNRIEWNFVEHEEVIADHAEPFWSARENAWGRQFTLWRMLLQSNRSRYRERWLCQEC